MTVKHAATVATLAVAVLVPAASAHAVRSPIPVSARPHSRVVTYDRGEVLVRRLQMNVHRVGHRLRTSVRLTVLSTSRHAVHRVLRVATCTHGLRIAPICPGGLTVSVRLKPGQRRSYARIVRLRQPPARPDAIQAALIKPGARTPLGYARRTDGVLLLKGGAWRGAGAGHTYGVSFVGDDLVRRLNFDIPATSRHRAYVDVKWQGSGAPSALQTTLSHCARGTCRPATLRPDPRRSADGVFGNRFDVTQGGAEALLLQSFTPDSRRVMVATLPWPG